MCTRPSIRVNEWVDKPVSGTSNLFFFLSRHFFRLQHPSIPHHHLRRRRWWIGDIVEQPAAFDHGHSIIFLSLNGGASHLHSRSNHYDHLHGIAHPPHATETDILTLLKSPSLPPTTCTLFCRDRSRLDRSIEWSRKWKAKNNSDFLCVGTRLGLGENKSVHFGHYNTHLIHGEDCKLNSR